MYVLWLKPRLHDTTCCQTDCQTGCQTGLTTSCIVYTNIQPVVKPTGCQTRLTTGLTTGCIVYIQPVVKTVVKPGLTPVERTVAVRSTRLSNPVVKPVWQPVVSRKRGMTFTIKLLLFICTILYVILPTGVLNCSLTDACWRFNVVGLRSVICYHKFVSI